MEAAGWNGVPYVGELVLRSEVAGVTGTEGCG